MCCPLCSVIIVPSLRSRLMKMSCPLCSVIVPSLNSQLMKRNTRRPVDDIYWLVSVAHVPCLQCFDFVASTLFLVWQEGGRCVSENLLQFPPNVLFCGTQPNVDKFSKWRSVKQRRSMIRNARRTVLLSVLADACRPVYTVWRREGSKTRETKTKEEDSSRGETRKHIWLQPIQSSVEEEIVSVKCGIATAQLC